MATMVIDCDAAPILMNEALGATPPQLRCQREMRNDGLATQ